MSDQPLIRHGAAALSPVPREGTHGVRAAVLQLPASVLGRVTSDDLAARHQGLPLLLDQPASVILLSFEQGGAIDEHDAGHDIVFIVVSGGGFTRVGGPAAPEVAVAPGDAILWPPHVPHVAWTTDTPMLAISIEYADASSPRST